MEYFTLLKAHQGYLERIALAMLGSRADAEDALQEMAFAGYQHVGQLQGGEHAFGAWMRRILIRQCRRILDGRKNVVAMDEVGEHLLGSAPGPDPEATAVWEMVAGLPDHLRPVVVMRYLLDYSQQEVADELGLPLGTVKSRLGKALTMLRNMDAAAAAPGFNQGGR